MLKTKYKVSKLNHIGNDRKFSVFKCTILKEQCHISRIFSFPFFLPFYKLLMDLFSLKHIICIIFTFLYIQRQQIAAKSLSLQRLHPASIFAFSHASNILFTLAKIDTILSLFFLYFTSYLIPIEKLFYFQPYHIAITYTNPILNISEHCFNATLSL